MTELLEGERIDEVNDRLRLIQKPEGLTFGTDALLLAGYLSGKSARGLELAFRVSRDVGLLRVYGSVMSENERSVAMLKKYMDICSEGDVIRFVLELE